MRSCFDHVVGIFREIWFLFAGLVVPDNPVLLTLKRELFDPLDQLRHFKQLRTLEPARFDRDEGRGDF